MQALLQSIQRGDSKATINPVGSALVSLVLKGKELIPKTQEPSHTYHGVTLAPWPNRIAAGRYSFRGANYQLAINEPFGNALHGFSFTKEASLRQQSPDSLTLVHRLDPVAGYPFSIEVALEFRITDDSLEVRTSAKNLGAESCPVGLGTHPFFVFDEQSTLEVFAKTAAVHGTDMMPVSYLPAAEIGFGAANPRLINQLPLDVQFSDIAEVCAVLRTATHDFEVFQSGANWLMVYTTEQFNWADGRTKAVAIEPQTCAADAFNSGQGLKILEPGENFEYRWGVRITK